jgi:hypothetical protein
MVARDDVRTGGDEPEREGALKGVRTRVQLLSPVDAHHDPLGAGAAARTAATAASSS